jgi:hypothetical protein
MTEKNSPKPKPSSPKKVDAPVVYDAVLDDDTIAQHIAAEVEAEVEVVAEAEADVVVVADDTEVPEKVEAPVTPAAKKSSAPASEYAVVSGNGVDEVRLSSVVFENVHAKKSLSVHHIQRRLKEWGFMGGYLDRDGWYGTSTRDAIHEFQASQGLPVGELDMATLVALFENDTNVRVLP